MAKTITVAEKYESIDQSKLSKDLSHVLLAMKKKSKNFTSEKENKAFEPKLDKIIATLKSKYPEAVKGGVNKIQTKKTPKNKIEEALDSLDALIERDPMLKGFSGSDIQRDATRKAKPAGKRISKDGNVYYEYRENRTDRLAPNFPKNRPFLEKGGEIVDGYNVEEVYANFIEAGLWSSYDNDEEPLEDNYSITDVDIESASSIMDGIKKFISKNKTILKRNNISPESLGHDLFLTSQGHGAGFWDRGYSKADGEALSKSSEEIFGSDSPYVGDDGFIYFSSVKLAKGGEMKTYADFNKDYDAFTNYVMDRITIEERQQIRKDWESQYKTGEKDWNTYLLSRVNKKSKKSLNKGGQISTKSFIKTKKHRLD